MLAGLLRLPLYLPAATAVVSLAGTAAGSSSATGTLTVGHSLTGAAAGTSTVTGTLTVGHQLAGAAAGTSTAAGTLTVRHALSGAAAGTSSVTGDLTVAAGLAGAAAGTSTVTGTLTPVPRALSGSASGTSTVAGALTVAHRLAGVAVGTSSASGTLTTSNDPRHVVYGPVSLAQGIGRISAETGTTAPIRSTSAVTAPITAAAALSGPIRAYSEDSSMAVLHPNNDHVVKVGPLSVIVAGVELPAPGVGLTLSAFVSDTDDMLDAVALGTLTISLPETEPGVSGQYDGAFQGADLAADVTLAAAPSGTPYYVHIKDSTGSYHEVYEAPWERTRLAEVA